MSENSIIPKAESFFLHTSNILNTIRPKASRSSSDELSECISLVFKDWISKQDHRQLQEVTDIQCTSDKSICSPGPVNCGSGKGREQVKLTVKLFLYDLQPQTINDAISSVMAELNVSYIDTVIISCPIDNEEQFSVVEKLMPIWRNAENFVPDKVFGLGICDLQFVELRELFKKATVNPTINQVNLADCCVMPPELTEFAKENDVQLLTHNDAPTIITSNSLEDIIASHSTRLDGSGWSVSWAARYSTLVKQQGVIISKGYFLKASRQIKAIYI